MSGLKTYLERATKEYTNQLRSVKPGNDPFGVIPYLTSHGIGYQVALDYKLGVVATPLMYDEDFTGMLAIPYLTPHGVSAIKFRRLAAEGPKYMAHKGQKARLYNVAAYFAADDMIGLAEGEIDAISATERLGVPTMGIPGSEMWQANKGTWAPIFKDFRTVLIFADGDPINKQTGLRPGEELAKAVSETIGWRAKVIQCPEGEDVSSLIASGNIGFLTERFSTSKDDDK